MKRVFFWAGIYIFLFTATALAETTLKAEVDKTKKPPLPEEPQFESEEPQITL